MTHELRWYKRAADHQVFGLGPLFVTRWHNAVDITLLHDQNVAQREHAKHAGAGKRLLIMAIVDHAGMPKADSVNAEFRETARRYSLENQDHVGALGNTAMAGFICPIWAAVGRAI